MNDIILHHYPTSPFAEKIRRVLAYKKLPWKSVIIPAVMPKPDLMPLTGGYRRTPVLQVGGQKRISRRVSLISENYLIANSHAGFGGLYGAKINWRRTSLALMRVKSLLVWNLGSAWLWPSAMSLMSSSRRGRGVSTNSGTSRAPTATR